MMLWKSITITILLVLSASLSGCIEQAEPKGKTIEIRSFSFHPDSLSVPAGTTVTWINRDPTDHSVSADDGSFESGDIKTGKEFNHAFIEPKTYRYRCSIHPSMTGQVMVTGAGNPGAKLETNQSVKGLAGLKVGLELVAEGFVAPIGLVGPGDGTGRIFIVDQVGVIKVMMANGTLLDGHFLDLRDRMVQLMQGYDERGLLGLAFHPDFAKNGRLFVLYSAPLRPGAPAGWNCTTLVSEFKVFKDRPNQVDMGSERTILQVDKPQFNHNGGTIAFGPDGYLYIPLGDGGGAGDVGLGHSPDGNGQNASTLLGKILRIDVNNQSGKGYSIPPDNPFVGKKEFRPEIYAYGLRNPYRIAFDASDGRLFAADAGQDLWEEVDIIVKGGNYGWRIREGTHCFDPSSPKSPPSTCPEKGARGEPLLGPVIEYGHALGKVVVGGHVYRGRDLPELEGAYIFADWSDGFVKGNGTLLIATQSTQGTWSWEEVGIATSSTGRVDAFIRSFGQDDLGELYLLTSDKLGPMGETGKVYKIVPANATKAKPSPG
jgi:glucose/arabinose dehydrogenase/plastocyanin